ncbi:hypothetical protein DPMN_091149 [Dreissena polymorpha]|uniref:Uncharacterized protein n=1 Tax=Dreissena polymorpha TaxID=45954 RepID=A0A9D4L016_DREPO|nr:hypothetical protein DPMN_091149 [Dreissena polymorpha]
MEPMDVQLHDDLEPEPSLVDLNESLDDATPEDTHEMEPMDVQLHDEPEQVASTATLSSSIQMDTRTQSLRR